MYVGEIAHLCAEVTFCAEHSLEVKATVQAENLFTGLILYYYHCHEKLYVYSFELLTIYCMHFTPCKLCFCICKQN